MGIHRHMGTDTGTHGHGDTRTWGCSDGDGGDTEQERVTEGQGYTRRGIGDTGTDTGTDRHGDTWTRGHKNMGTYGRGDTQRHESTGTHRHGVTWTGKHTDTGTDRHGDTGMGVGGHGDRRRG